MDEPVPRPVDSHRQALERSIVLGDRIGESEALIRLGNAQQVAGARDAARDSWRCALQILDTIAHSDAELVRAQLHGVGDLYWPHR